MSKDQRHIFFIGLPKAGSTYVHRALLNNPQLRVPSVKEIHYFNRIDALSKTNTNYLRPQKWYQQFFPKKKGGHPVDFTPFYIFEPDTAYNLYQYDPCAKIIITHRDFYDSLVSYTAMCLGRGYICEEKISDFFYSEYSILSRLQNVNYGLSKYIELFGRDNIHLISFDDIRVDPARSLRSICSFLEVIDLFDVDVSDYKNSSVQVRSFWIEKVAYFYANVLDKTILGRQALRLVGIDVLFRRIKIWNRCGEPKSKSSLYENAKRLVDSLPDSELLHLSAADLEFQRLLKSE